MRMAFRKALLTAHVVSSVGWIGALMVFMAHAALAVSSEDREVVRAACFAMASSAWLVILPLAIATVVTGVIQALNTSWGLLHHYWVMFKLGLAAVATGVLLLKLSPLEQLAQLAAQGSFASTAGSRVSMLVHAIGGLAILFAATVLAIYKPAGVRATRPVPAWVKAFATASGLLALLLIAMAISGEHGPNMHH